MKVSVIIPACEAQSTIVRAVLALRSQSYQTWEAIIVADDGFDYAAFLAAEGVADPRLRFVSTSQIRSGGHKARNVGLTFATGDFVAPLDADDRFEPDHLENLVPLALKHGAAVDNVALILEETGERVSTAMGATTETVFLDIDMFLPLNAPLFPVVRRDHVLPRADGPEIADDFVANIRLIDRIGVLPVTAASTYLYHLRRGSITRSTDSVARFDAEYASYMAGFASGDFGVSRGVCEKAIRRLVAKRALNRAYGAALIANPTLDFMDFVRQPQIFPVGA